MAQLASHVEQLAHPTDATLIPFFVLGLHPYLRWEVSKANPSTLKEAMEKARQCSLEIPPPWYSMDVPQSAPQVQVPVGPSPMELDYSRLQALPHHFRRAVTPTCLHKHLLFCPLVQTHKIRIHLRISSILKECLVNLIRRAPHIHDSASSGLFSHSMLQPTGLFVHTISQTSSANVTLPGTTTNNSRTQSANNTHLSYKIGNRPRDGTPSP